MRIPRGMPPNAMLELIEPTHQRLYAFMGQSLLFQTNDSAVLEMADQALGRFPPLSDGEQSLLLIRLFVHEIDSKVEERVDPPKPIYRTQGHLFYISMGEGNVAVGDLLKGEAFGFVIPQIARDELLLRHGFLEALALILLSTACHYIPIHAACVVKEGRSIILAGKEGAGKSTLAFACARRGYQVLSEDAIFAQKTRVGMRLWGMPWRLHLLPDSKQLFPELEKEQPRVRLSGEWKLEIDLEAMFPGSTVTNALPGLVLFMERGTPPAIQFQPMPFEEALEALEIVWPWAVGWTNEMDQGMRDLLEGKAYRFWIEGSPDDIVDMMDTLWA